MFARIGIIFLIAVASTVACCRLLNPVAAIVASIIIWVIAGEIIHRL
ncbi:MAG: hypothetical protein Q4B65_00260 [Candidatus Saccharibacteria bacterium]|nr:hypothetical protein [Candidatus Saccharibacteria bacterium]